MGLRKLVGAIMGTETERQSRTVPENHRVYAIGDIHGCVGLLRDLQSVVLEDATKYGACEKTVVYTGDYVDRGLYSKEVIDQLVEHPLPGFTSVHLKGNHEAMMLDFLDNADAGSSWMQIGGTATLFSYQVGLNEKLPPAERPADAQKKLLQKIPEPHVEFLQSLQLYYAIGDYLFVHAGVKPHVVLAEQREEDLLWIRDEFVGSNVDHGCVVVHGHSIAWEPEVKPNRIGIDTGAYATGILTCLALYGTDQEFLQTDGAR